MFVYIVYESQGYGAGASVVKVFLEETAAQLCVMEMNEDWLAGGSDADSRYFYEEQEVF